MAEQRPTADALLARLKDRERPRLRVYIGAAPGVGKTYEMLQEAHALRARGLDVVVGVVETYGRRDTEAQIRDLEVIPRRKIEYRGVVLEEMDVDAHHQAPAPGVRGRRAGTHERRRQPEREALPGRARDSRCRHPRHDGGEHPAPRDAERRRRQGDRRARTGNGARYVPRPRRRSHQRRRDGRGAPQPASRGKDLPPGESRAGAHQFLPQGQPVDAARAGAARGGRRSGRESRELPSPGGAGAGADSGAGDGLHELECVGPAGHPDRRPHCGPAGVEMVCGVCGDAAGAAKPHQARGCRCPATEHPARGEPRRDGGSGQGRAAGGRPHRVCPARGRDARHLRPERIVALGARPARIHARQVSERRARCRRAGRSAQRRSPASRSPAVGYHPLSGCMWP